MTFIWLRITVYQLKTLSTILTVLICFSFLQMRISKRFGYEKRFVRLTLKLERSEKEVLIIQNPRKGLYFYSQSRIENSIFLLPDLLICKFGQNLLERILYSPASSLTKLSNLYCALWSVLLNKVYGDVWDAGVKLPFVCVCCVEKRR